MIRDELDEHREGQRWLAFQQRLEWLVAGVLLLWGLVIAEHLLRE